MFADRPPTPVNPDILLAKLRPGQELRMELHCEKGIGRDHAKFSPVATASYRLLPHIQIQPEAIPPHLHAKFVKCFPPGVIGIRRRTDDGAEEVYVKNPRKDTVSREVLRYPEFEPHVKLGRIRDHFLCKYKNRESTCPKDALLTFSSPFLLLPSRRGIHRTLRTTTAPARCRVSTQFQNRYGPQGVGCS